MILFEEFLAVVLGGALGSVLRFVFSRWVSELLPRNFPWGIWMVNVLGSLLVGVCAALFFEKYVHSTFVRTLVIVGVLGGFTTFSSFSLDTFTLLQGGQVAKAFLYGISTMVLSVLLTAAGFFVTRSLF